MSHWPSDTIAAIATAPGEAGLCIVRMSGPSSIHIADKIFSGHAQPSKCQSHTVHYGHIVEPLTRAVVDEVLLTIMHKPKTFTCEDVIEISGHGGYLSGTRILDTLINNGARLAQPGEFTKRAFLNGRLDLLQAEAVAEIIRGRTNAAHRAGLRQLNGTFSNTLNELRNGYLSLLSLIEVGLDFTEEHIEEFEYSHFQNISQSLHQSLSDVLSNARCWRNLREGVRMLLVGRPNVGKSSLLNRFVDHERAIVDATPGTTRDTIEESLDFNGVPVSIIDTAGIRISDGSIETKGIERTIRETENTDLCLWVIDGSQPLQANDELVYSYLQSDKTIGIINKSDMGMTLPQSALGVFNVAEWNHVSALTGDGLDDLKQAIYSKLIGQHDITESQALVNTRQLDNLQTAEAHSNRVLEYLNQHIDQEIISIEVNDVIKNLDLILGIEIGDDLLDRIFSSFCIGK